MMDKDYALDYLWSLDSAHDDGRHGDDESYYWRANGCRHCYAERIGRHVQENF